MAKKYRAIFATLLVLGVLTTIFFLIQGNNFAILNPKGTIAVHQRNLILWTLFLSLFVVIPVYTMTVLIALKYRSSNNKPKKYTPDWGGHVGLELLYWGVPLVLIVILSIVTWKSSHDLDPFKPIYAEKKPVKIQVVALDWKWLFIYPEEDIATVNYLQIPEDTPIDFEITSDAAMNSFWIPQLGGQIYAMAGMSTQLHLMANEPGTYEGSSANLSGRGFAGMKFKTVATSEDDYTNWVSTVRSSHTVLDADEYNKISAPSENAPVSTYSIVDKSLYDTVVMKYMMPAESEHHSETH